MKRVGIGLLGCGTVGGGVVTGLKRHGKLLAQRSGCELTLVRVAEINPKTALRAGLAPEQVTDNAYDVINAADIDVVVELIGGTGAAREFVLAAFKAGKSVVTANKKLLAEHGEEIFNVAEQAGVDIYFGASVGGGIPVVRVLREGLAGNLIQSIYGILNGTCNYILTNMEQNHWKFDAALAAAQKAGYAEANPALDIDGGDTAHKAVILASLAYGFHVPFDKVLVEGIRDLSEMDVRFAAALGYRIKLLAIIKRGCGEIEIGVYPALVPHQHMLSNVNQVFNAVMVRGDLSDDTLYYGRGAGCDPTASTVIADICDIARNLSRGQPRFKRGIGVFNRGNYRIRSADEITSRYYLRLMVLDKAGSLGTMTTILGRHAVSILAATQQECEDVPDGAAYVPVVMLTHTTRSLAIESAINEIHAAGVVSEKPVALRIME